MIERPLLMFMAGLFVTFLNLCIYTAQAEMEVYDGKNQYLGVLAGDPTEIIPVFVPTISSILSISTKTGDIYGYQWFESSDCTGTAYLRSSDMYNLYRLGGKYYTGKKVVPVMRKIESEKSAQESGDKCYYDWMCDVCGSYFNTVPIEEVLPSDVPTLPVALPLCLKYSSGGGSAGDLTVTGTLTIK